LKFIFFINNNIYNINWNRIALYIKDDYLYSDISNLYKWESKEKSILKHKIYNCSIWFYIIISNIQYFFKFKEKNNLEAEWYFN
jgi:hypothetical protein